MIVTLALAVQVAAVPPPVAVADDIVVIGQRLKSWQGSFRMKKGKYACQVTKSTGDAEIDRIGCEAMRACLIPAMPRYEATRAKGLDAATRKRMTQAVDREMTGCLTERRNAMIAELADRRAGGGA